MTPAEILTRAAEILEARGPDAELMRPTLCAMESACGGTLSSTLLFERACDLATRRAGDSPALVLVAWLEHPSRTLPQVLATLRGEDWRNVK